MALYNLIKKNLSLLFSKKDIKNSIITPEVSDISEDIVKYGDILAFRKPATKYTNDRFDGGDACKEEDYKLYKISQIV